MGNYDYLLCHYHKVDSLLWLEVKNWLQQVLKARIEQSTEKPTIFLSTSMGNDLMEFLREMECAYIHPRRDSFHVQKCLFTYSGFSVPANHASRKHSLSLDGGTIHPSALPSTKKNLKPYRKEAIA